MGRAEDIWRWESDLKQQFYRANAALRNEREHGGADPNMDHIRQGAETLGIDPERAMKIVRAARYDIDWHDAVDAMVRGGMEQDDAESVLRDITARMSAVRSLNDAPYESASKRIGLALSIVGLVTFVLVIGAGVVYWSWIVSVLRQCFA